MKLINQSRRDFLKITGAGTASLMFMGFDSSGMGNMSLDDEFESPPDADRPHTFWHWMNGNVTKEGITEDIRAMKECGIGGVFLFVLEGHVTETVPVYIEKPVHHLTPEWFEMIRHAALECKAAGLELSLMNCVGWTASGGKWIPPEKSMMRVAWSDVYFKGPGKMEEPLPLPPCDYANYQNLTKTYPHIHESVPPEERYYEDMVVLAYPLHASAAAVESQWPPRLSCSAGDADTAHAIDGNGATSVTIPEKGYLQLDFAEPVGVRGVEYLGTACELQCSEDGTVWKAVAALPAERNWGYPHSLPLSYHRARYFRLFFAEQGAVKNIRLYGDSLVHDYQRKASFHGVHESIKTAEERIGQPTPAWVESTINSDQVIDVSRYLRTDGTLDWEAPPGEWVVTRIGCAPIGRLNSPGAREFVGLECNKLDADAVEFHFNNYVGPVLDRLEDLAGTGIHAVHIDSWEAGDLNFTPRFREEFYKRRGYDATPHLLVHAGGKIVDGAANADRFLWDVRQTIGDLIAENYLAKLTELCHGRNVKFQGENIGVNVGATVSQLKAKAHGDMPMGEFQMPNFLYGDSWARWDCVEAASAAHIYGKPRAGAEAFTCFDRWITDPYGLKGVGDLAFAMGVNRLVFHTWALNYSDDRAPGMTMGPFGVNFSRLNTWWGRPAKSHLKYLQRCQYLLQKGEFVADILYMYGEGAPNTLPEKQYIRPELPHGYAYDGCDAESLSRLKVKDGLLVFPSGATYRMLVCKQDHRMTPEVVIRLKELVEAGAMVHCTKPTESPSLVNFPQCDNMVRQVADELWGEVDGKTTFHRPYGAGRIISGIPVADALKLIGKAPDVVFLDTREKDNLNWLHRKTDDADMYFFSNQKNVIDHGLSLEIIDRRQEALSVNEIEKDRIKCKVSFRCTGKQPELWDPVTGQRRDLPEFEFRDGRTEVPLVLESSESFFIIFRKPISANRAVSRKNFPQQEVLTTLSGPWNVVFDPEKGGPGEEVFEALEDWTQHSDPGIRNYSGKAIYRKTFHMDGMGAGQRKGRFFLDLGRLRSIAEIRLNGKDAGIRWCPPWRVEVTGLLKNRNNKLEITITNVWANRLIGDAGLPEEKRITWTSLNDTRWAVKPDQALVPAGLYGPVTIVKTT